MSEITVRISSFLSGKYVDFIVRNKRKGIEIEKVEREYSLYADKNEVIPELIRQCINMDEWKHSWHTEINKTRESKNKIREIIKGKIAGRKEEIEKLQFCLNVIGKWH